MNRSLDEMILAAQKRTVSQRNKKSSDEDHITQTKKWQMVKR